ncbi:PREDICTED: uncharacterized protein LOC107114047 [Gekko japonicus]|uniref:Uncharacterized protein LOC107114047 n=1 Tax=Gekko japonicus TaxID=146911 RepID=A0ABM1KB66_GEKJA|nr:PREDICTED: uncharacterized protein LOC107114047 [Gekko japonicus]
MVFHPVLSFRRTTNLFVYLNELNVLRGPPAYPSRLKERSVLEQPTPRDAEEVIQQPAEQSHIRTGLEYCKKKGAFSVMKWAQFSNCRCVMLKTAVPLTSSLMQLIDYHVQILFLLKRKETGRVGSFGKGAGILAVHKHRSAEEEPEDEIQSLLREALNLQLGETDEEHEHEGTQFQQEENIETPEDTVEVPVVEENYDRELEDKMPDILATLESFQEELTSDHEVREPELDEPHGTHEYDTNVEENTYEAVEPDASELTLEDALVDETEAFSEHEEQQDYVDEHEMENEDYVETQDTDGEPVTEHYYEVLEEETLQAEPVESAEQRNEHEVDAPETISEHTESDEGEHGKNHMDGQPRETEVPFHTEVHSKDDLVDT